MPNQPRLPSGAYSAASNAAPPHSPPRPIPWPKRSRHSSAGGADGHLAGDGAEGTAHGVQAGDGALGVHFHRAEEACHFVVHAPDLPDPVGGVGFEECCSGPIGNGVILHLGRSRRPSSFCPPCSRDQPISPSTGSAPSPWTRSLSA